nr:hypothetical protein [Malaciobacter halophilus]
MFNKIKQKYINTIIKILFVVLLKDDSYSCFNIDLTIDYISMGISISSIC